MKNLKNISLQYEDGATQNIDYHSLDAGMQAALVSSGLCDPPSGISSARSYLILRWKDGWKEVLAVNGEMVDLIRYYVIRRIEDRGRIALDTGSIYPQLIIIERLPAELSRILIAGDGGVKSYDLRAEVESYEGIFESGGKREYKKYDKSNPYFKNAFSEDGGIAEITSMITEALKRKNLNPAELLSLEWPRRVLEYKDIAGMSGLKGFQRQGDVYGLIEMILKNIVKQRS